MIYYSTKQVVLLFYVFSNMQLLTYYPADFYSKTIVTDSRQLTVDPNAVFFAIKGVNHNGHDYVLDLYNKGIRYFVVETTAITSQYLKAWSQLPTAYFFEVDNSIAAIQALAASIRRKYDIPIIGITGSNGKTIVKEWLATLLYSKFYLAKSPKSYNSQLGVPLSVAQLREQHNLGIFEAGISKPGEMQQLEQIIKPTIGIFTNIGTAHAEHFASIQQKIQEKLQLFEHAKCLIWNADDSLLHEAICSLWKSKIEQKVRLDWSINGKATVNFEIADEKGYRKLKYTYGADTYTLQVHFYDAASVQNLCHCIVLMRYLQIDWLYIQTKINLLRQLPMRLSLKAGIKNSQLIDDTYNNDLVGVKLALDFLQQQKVSNNKVCVLSDLLQSGENEAELYAKMAQLLSVNEIDTLIAVGPAFERNRNLFKNNSMFFANTELLIEKIHTLPVAHSIVLLKGARKYAFEQIVALLEEQQHDTVLEINLDALTHNLNFFKAKLSANTKIMAMVKAFAYGAGNTEVAQLLQYHGVDYLGVAYTDEGVYLRQQGVNLPIMVLNPQVSDFERLMNYSLEPEVYSLEKLKALVFFMDGRADFVKIHIKLDTGMRRLGFDQTDIPELIEILKNSPNIVVVSMFSHLAASENEQMDDYTNQQAEKLQNYTMGVSDAIGYKPMVHLLNSSGISRWPKYQFDMVRLGVGLYGVGCNASETAQLQVVGTLKTQVSQVKYVELGETIGYGRKGKANRNTQIATIAIGYADGFRRSFGNGVGKVAIAGKLYPTIGNICMDMCMIDVTDGNVSEGDEVIVFGQNPTVFDLATQANTIAYEILTNVGERVKRVFLKE
jgi:Alr-MurF fusion protein